MSMKFSCISPANISGETHSARKPRLGRIHHFNSWASTQTFKVGDELKFKYSLVAELPSESSFKSCDISVASNLLSGGDGNVKLTKPGMRFFECGTSGHCAQGMKVKITTVAADGS